MKSARYPHLPPLNTLLIFEAAARHESFVKAADELCLTASAVAHQIKKLEASLGVTLFIRHARGVSLSPQSREYSRHVRKGLNELHHHSGQLKDFTLRALRISTQHAIAQLWLQPRLGEYQDKYSDREFEITACSRIDDAPTDADIAISYFAEPPSDKAWHLLWEEMLLPVSHPGYMQQESVLYRDVHWWDDWDIWQKRAKVKLGRPLDLVFSRLRSASLYVLVLQSVLDQRGVMVARQSLLKDYLRSGELVVWPEAGLPVVTCGAYYLYQSPASLNNPFANDFREWLIQQVSTSENAGLDNLSLSENSQI